MKGLWKYIKPQLWVVLLTLLVKFTGTYVELWIPTLMETMLDEKVPQGKLEDIYIYGGLMILCALGSVILNLFANAVSAFTAGRITKSVRRDLFAKLQRLSARQMDALTIPSAESRLTSDTYYVNNVLTRLQRIGIRGPILLVGGLIMMFQLDVKLALVMVALLPAMSVVIFFVSKKSLPLYGKQQTVVDKVVRTVQENITGIRVTKALSKTEYEKERFEQVNAEQCDISQRAGMVTGITGPSTMTLLRIGLSLVVLMGAFRVNSGAIKPGAIIAALQYFTMITTAMNGVTHVFIMLSWGEASAKRISSVLELPEDMAVQPQTEEVCAEAPAHIEFKNVNFSYTGVGKTLTDISFRLERGQTLGILGGTGSGKSTVLNLLMRLYDADSGEILLDGRDIKTIPYEELRQKFGIVFQNDFITEGTIGHNIRFFRDIPDEALEKAAQCAQASFIAEKEGGMEAEVVIRGNNLSGGQKQRLLIARALAADPEILVLDDASSALDYRTDAQLRKALRENYRDTTTVLVTQRISSLCHADWILVLAEGCIIGAGKHEQLMETCEEYRSIAQTQMGDGKEVS